LEEQVISGVRWTFLAYALSRLVGLASTFVLARLLVPGDFGIVALAAAAVELVSYLTGLGLGPATVLRQDLTGDDLGTAFTLVVATNIAAALALVCLAPAVGSIVRDPQVTPVVRALAAPLLVGGVTSFYESLLQRELRFRPLFIARAVQMVSSVLASVVLAMLGFGLWSLVLGRVVGELVFPTLLVVMAPHSTRPSYQRRVAVSMLRSGRGFIAQSVFSFVEQNSDYAVVGRTLGAKALGIYSLGFRIGQVPYSSIVEPVAQATFPGFARMRERGEDLGGAYLTLLRLSSVCVVPLGMMTAGAAGPFVRTLLGPRWNAVIGVLPLLAFWGTAHALAGTIGWFVSGVGFAARLGRAYACLVLLSIPVLVVAVGRFGIRGAAITMLGNATVTVAIGVRIASRGAGVPWRSQWKAVRPALAAAVPTVVAAAGVSTWLHRRPPALALGVAVVVSGAVYLLTLSSQEPRLIAQVGTQLGRVARGHPNETVWPRKADSPPGEPGDEVQPG
jgi:PST family polysaccharide transporter